jgi:glucose/arabinose dehydrogenase
MPLPYPEQMPTSSRPARRLAGPAALALAVAVALGACGGQGPTAAPQGSAGTGGGSGRPDLAAVRVGLETVVGGFARPLLVAPVPDGSGRLFVAEQGGLVRVVRDGRIDSTPFLDVTDRTGSGRERGLLGLAFPPGFGDQSPLVFAHYSDRNGDTTVSSFGVAPGDTGTADTRSEEVRLHVTQPYANHNGGWIGFDPDGMLLIALGDGGSGGDPENRASDLGQLLGKMLRIDVLGGAADEPYAIPADNPFVGRAGARPEILDYGLRNPFRDSFDLETGDLWIGDVGQGKWEEIDVARAGAKGLDFGWRRWEGGHCFNPPTGCDPTGVTMPVAEYPHPLGCAVIGGVVYRGDAIPALRGAYLFSDNCSGTLWAIDAALDAPQAPITLLETRRAISSIGFDEDGEVLLTDLARGDILRLVPAG